MSRAMSNNAFMRDKAARLCSALACTRSLEGYERLSNNDIEDVMLGLFENDDAYWLARKAWIRCAPRQSMTDSLRWALAEAMIRTGEIQP